jgi:hypothetical protein
MGPGPPVHAPLLNINVEEPLGSHNGRKVKGHLPTREWSPFLSYLSLLVPSSMTRLLFGAYPASLWSAILLGLWPALGENSTSVTPHLFWNCSASAGMGFTISTKSSNSPPPGSCLCCPLLQEQIDPTVWTDGMTVGWARKALPIQRELKDPSQFPHTKTISLQAWGKMMPYTYHKFLKKGGGAAN